MLNLQPISNVVGVLLVILGFSMLLCLPVSWYYASGDGSALFNSGAFTCITGILLWKYKFNTNKNTLNKREGYMIVALSWLFMSVFCAIPYYLSGVLHNPVDALFESVSGLTTTGATVVKDIEILPKGILIWRSMTQWLGGMGIIVLTIAIFPLLGIAGIELFTAESPGPTTDKIHPRIKETAKRLWLLYVSITLILVFILYFEGMSLFEAVNHAFTTMATGGFSTRNASAAAFSPAIQYTLTIFMAIAGVNYFVIYSLVKGRFRKAWTNEEFRLYILTILFFTALVMVGIYNHSDLGGEKVFRDSIFQVVSLITTTGYVSADYESFGYGVTALCFIMLFIGASAGSTAGGIKIVRHLVFIKNSALEFKRILHPRAMIRLKINQTIVAPRVLTHILVFLLIYLAVFVTGVVSLTMLDVDLLTASGAAATCLGNAGPGLGKVGPLFNFAELSNASKSILSFIMVVGRLELFTILVLFTPYFWKLN